MSSNISLDDSICIFEKDINSDVLLTWTFPSIDDNIRQVVLNRTSLGQEKISLSFNFSKYKNTWIYIYTNYISSQDSQKEGFPENMKSVVAYSICLMRNNFNPEKYGSLAQIMSNVYLSTGNASKLLECHLRVVNRGQFDVGPLGKFNDVDFDVRRSYLATSIKDIIQLFGEEIILIWSAMIMKKRIVVYAEKTSSLLKVIRAFPLLVSHRQNWNILRPFVTMSDIELKDLSGVYVAGFTDSSIQSHEELYDLFVDLGSKDIKIASHAKDQFILGSFHRDFLKFFLGSLDNEEMNDQAIIKGLSQKTKELITKLETLKEEKDGKSQITLESLESKKLPNGMSNFLYSIANAEGLNGQ